MIDPNAFLKHAYSWVIITMRLNKLFSDTYLKYIFIGLYSVVMVLTCLLIVVCILKQNVFNAEWIGFWGSIIGAGATIAAVLLTVWLTKKHGQERLRADLFPYIHRIWYEMNNGRMQFNQLLQVLNVPFEGVENGDVFQVPTSEGELTQRVLKIHSERMLVPNAQIALIVQEHNDKIPPTIREAIKPFTSWLEYAHGNVAALAIGQDLSRQYAISQLIPYSQVLKDRQLVFKDAFESYVKGTSIDLTLY